MYKLYFKQAWQLMKQNRFFSLIYILGTGMAISMVMLMAIVYHIRTANIEPEVYRDRMLYIPGGNVMYKRDNGSSNFGLAAHSARECLGNMKKPEAVAIYTLFLPFLAGDSFVQLSGGDEVWKVSLSGTNDGYWKVFRFHFLEGKPYGTEEFEAGIARAVVSASTAQRLFGSTVEVLGKRFLLNEVEYAVCGVVEDVSAITATAFADVWVPYTSLSLIKNAGVDEQNRTVGPLDACLLAHSPDDFDAIRKELDSEIGRYNTTLTEGKLELGAPLLTHGQKTIYVFTSSDNIRWVVNIFLLILFLFLLIPALNLSGLNASRMQERISELGVRKAFGAWRNRLFIQLFIENMILMLPGAATGLLLSFILVGMLRSVLLSAGTFAIFMGTGASLDLTPGMLLNMEVFGYAFAACLLLNLLSSFIPVWRALRVSITNAINDK